MFKSIILIIYFIVLMFGCSLSDHHDHHDEKVKVEKAFKDSQITPDVVKTPPAQSLHIKFEKPDEEVKLGNKLKPMQVRDEPEIHYHCDHGYYTLIMTDPDAPSRKNPVEREWNHWLVVNIPGSDIKKGQIIAEYVGSAPPKDSGYHRYVFLLYKQPQLLQFDEPYKSNTNGNRGKFSTEAFAKKHGLGNPVAGNFYLADYDDSVPELHKQLGLNV